MSKVKTLVYFDLEATGLKCSGRPRITEISLVAVHPKDVEDLHIQIQNVMKTKKNVNSYQLQIENCFPRVLNKITLCVYPMTIIMPEVTDITGLDNYNLTDQARFNENTGNLIKNFLAQLPPPICLVAHNGNMYDFPLLKSELEKTCIQLGSETLCADSYVGMKAIFQERSLRSEAEVKESRYNPVRARKEDIDGRKTPQSYSLINLHRHLLDCRPIRSHGAEADCLALLRTTAALGNEWLEWLNKNCTLFTNCQKMWGWD